LEEAVTSESRSRFTRMGAAYDRLLPLKTGAASVPSSRRPPFLSFRAIVVPQSSRLPGRSYVIATPLAAFESSAVIAESRSRFVMDGAR